MGTWLQQTLADRTAARTRATTLEQEVADLRRALDYTRALVEQERRRADLADERARHAWQIGASWLPARRQRESGNGE